MDHDSTCAIELALTVLRCTQKELAARLGVSTAQISKWKSGEYMSFDMERKFAVLTGIGDMRPSVVVWAGSFEAAEQWDRLFGFLAESANNSADTGYSTYPLDKTDGYEMLTWSTVHTLEKMGVVRPKTFSAELMRALEKLDSSKEYSEKEYDNAWKTLHDNPMVAVVSDIYKALTDVYGFYTAYVQELIDNDNLNLLNTAADNIEPCLIDLAATKISVDQTFAPKFQSFRYEVGRDYRDWLTLVKDAAIRNHAPLRAELLDMVTRGRDSLGHDAEAECLGFNESRLHPDIYMNELLVGMRMIHQVLPAIMKKLEIHDDFELDQSDLYNSSPKRTEKS